MAVAAKSPEAEQKARRLLLLSCSGIALGLAVAGTIDNTTGGVIAIVGWLACIAALHRLGRSGSERRSPT